MMTHSLLYLSFFLLVSTAGCLSNVPGGGSSEGKAIFPMLDAYEQALDAASGLMQGDFSVVVVEGRENRISGNTPFANHSDDLRSSTWIEADPEVNGSPHAWLFGFKETNQDERALGVAVGRHGEVDTQFYELHPNSPLAGEPINLHVAATSTDAWQRMSASGMIGSCVALDGRFWPMWQLVQSPTGPIWNMFWYYQTTEGLLHYLGHIEMATNGTLVNHGLADCALPLAQGEWIEWSTIVPSATWAHNFSIQSNNHSSMAFFLEVRGPIMVASGSTRLVISDPEARTLALEQTGGSGSQWKSWPHVGIIAGDWTIKGTIATSPDSKIIVGWCADGLREADAGDACDHVYIQPLT